MFMFMIHTHPPPTSSFLRCTGFVTLESIPPVPTVCVTVSFCEVTFLQGVSRRVWDSITESRNLKLHVFVVSWAW